MHTQTIPAYVIPDPLTVNYNIEYPDPENCAVTGGPAGILTFNISGGQSALNVLEAGADIDNERSFVVSVFIGQIYFIERINIISNNETCIWCALYSPAPNVNSYFLTTSVNRFIIPVSGGTLTLQYQTSCNSLQELKNVQKLFEKMKTTESSKTYFSYSSVFIAFVAMSIIAYVILNYI